MCGLGAGGRTTRCSPHIVALAWRCSWCNPGIVPTWGNVQDTGCWDYLPTQHSGGYTLWQCRGQVVRVYYGATIYGSGPNLRVGVPASHELLMIGVCRPQRVHGQLQGHDVRI